MGPRGSGRGVAQGIYQTGVVVMVGGFPREERDAVLRDAALPRQALLGDMTRHAVACELHLGVEHLAQTPALVVVAEAVEQVIAELAESPGCDRRGMDRVLALRSVERIGRIEQRGLLGRDEVVESAFDSRVVGDLLRAGDPGIGRRRRWRGLEHRPVRNDEFSHARQNKRVGKNPELRSLYRRYRWPA